jgi:hypothetical protein
VDRDRRGGRAPALAGPLLAIALAEETFGWPTRFEEPLLDGRKLTFSAPELELQQAWDAVKARVAATNLAYREQFPPGEQEADRRGDPEVYAQLRELATQRVDELT